MKLNSQQIYLIPHLSFWTWRRLKSFYWQVCYLKHIVLVRLWFKINTPRFFLTLHVLLHYLLYWMFLFFLSILVSLSVCHPCWFIFLSFAKIIVLFKQKIQIWFYILQFLFQNFSHHLDFDHFRFKDIVCLIVFVFYWKCFKLLFVHITILYS